MKLHKSILFYICLLGVVFSFHTVTAQEVEDIIIEDLSQAERDAFFSDLAEIIPPTPVQEAATGEGLVSCFDYYNFNSVDVNINPTLQSTVPGTAMTFSGIVTNHNNYPVVNGTVYAKIFKLRESDEKNENGPFVVDQYVAVENVSLQSNESREISFDWDVPSWTANGTYRVATFFISNNKYNLLGLSFTDDIVGNTAEFDVIATNTAGVYFDKDTVTINNELYQFATFPPRVEKDSTATITATITNETNLPHVIPVTLTTYAWDAIDPVNKITSEKNTVTVPANETVPITFTVRDNNHPVYLAELQLAYQDTASILNVRFVREDVDKLRINFPAVSSYPLQKNNDTGLFACFHNTTAATSAGRLELSVIDDVTGEVLHTDEYEGPVGGAMMAVASKFTPSKTYESFSIQANLYQNDILSDSDTVTYNCEAFNTCPELGSNIESSWLVENAKLLLAIVSIPLIVVIIILIVRISRTIKNRKNTSNPTTYV